MRTELTERLGLRHPIVQAPMGGVAGPALAKAVSAAGALGMLTAGPRSSAEDLRIASRTRSAFIVNSLPSILSNVGGDPTSWPCRWVTRPSSPVKCVVMTE
jgi:IMP dehydrogenase/GMP reductase